MMLKSISTIVKLIQRQSISKLIYFTFLFIIPFSLVLSLFFYFYINCVLNNYETLLQRSFFGYYPKASLLFSAKNRQTAKYIHLISKKLIKIGIKNSIVYTYPIGQKFKFIDKNGNEIKKFSTLLVYQDRYFQDKFGKNIDIVFTKTLFDSISHRGKIYFTANKKKILLKNYKIIDVGFLNVKSTLILSKSLFDKLNSNIYPTRIDIASDNKDSILKIVKKYKKRYIYIPNPKLKIYSEDKSLSKTKQLFSNLTVLKNIILTILIVMIFFLLIAVVNALKELKEREFEILKNLGFKTFEIIFGFLFIEFIMIVLSLSVSIILYMFYMGSFDVVLFVNSNMEILKFLLLCIFVILFFSIFYLWGLFRYEKFN